MSERCGYVRFWLAVAVCYVLVFVGAEFTGSPVAGAKGLLNLVAQWGVVSIPAIALIGLLALNRYIFAATFPLLLTLSAIAVYYRLTLGVAITATTIELTVTNNLATWASVISPLLIALVLLALAVGVGVAWYRFRLVKTPRRAWIWCVAQLAVALAPVTVVKRLKAPVTARIPYAFYFAVSEYLTNHRAATDERHTFDNVAASAPDDAPVVVFVIGESLRPDHLQLNGYLRATTPLLVADTAVVSLPHVTTQPCYTHVSVPRIVTRADSLSPDWAYSEQSFITLFGKAGYSTAWLSNQDTAPTYIYFMHEADTLVQCNAGRSFYDYSEWFDSDILPAFDAFMANPNPRKLAVVHSIGSHWWYPSHYPDSLARFKPEVNSRIVSELTKEQMVNSYDNTILATDQFLHSLIGRLRPLNAILIFISDHGEALGENGHFLHAADYPELHPTACLVWYSPVYAAKYPAAVAALRRNAVRSWSTDAMFHSVLHAAGITTEVINPSMSIFQ